MSEFIWLFGWMALMFLFSQFVDVFHEVTIDGKKRIRVRWWFAILVFVPIIWCAGMRSGIGDTGAYINMYKKIPKELSELIPYVLKANKDGGFVFLGGIIKSVFGDDTRFYFTILALIQGGILVYIYGKYSDSYLISVFLFLASADYISWMYNGVRQFMAVTLIVAATPLMIKKKWIPLIVIILLASTLHASALLMLPVVFIVQGKAWNFKTIMVIIGTLTVLMFLDYFVDVLDLLLEDTQYTNVVSEWTANNDDGTNLIRVLVYSVPVILSYIGRRWITFEDDKMINLCTNMSIISAALYVISAFTSGIFVGRLPIYASLYGYILLPYLIDTIFTEDSAKLVKRIMIVAYLFYYYYQMHFSWSYF